MQTMYVKDQCQWEKDDKKKKICSFILELNEGL